MPGFDALGRVRPYAPTLGLLVVLSVVAELVSAISPLLTRATILALTIVLMAVALQIFVGNSGILSFGHASFVAIGAYTAGILTIPVELRHVLLPHLPGLMLATQLSTPTATAVGGLAAAGFAAVVAVPLVRLSGVGAGIATLALLVIVHVVASNWDAVTRGSGTFLGVPMDTTVESALAWVAIAVLCARAYERSRWGRQVRAAAEDAVAANAIGINVARERYIALVASAFFAGVAGSLYAHFLGSFNPDTFYLQITFLVIAMLVVGGSSSLAGVVLAGAGISALNEVILQLEDGVQVGSVTLIAPTGAREVVVALVMLVTLLRWPGGIAEAAHHLSELRSRGNKIEALEDFRDPEQFGSASDLRA